MNDSTIALGELIEHRKEEIERRWLERVRRDLACSPGVSMTLLRDAIPEYLEALARLLRAGERSAASAWRDIAREHGITRVRIGFDIGQLIHEFIVLRHAIGEVADEEGIVASGAHGTLADLLESGITVAVQSYVDARDFEARRKQAEHIGFVTHELRTPLSTAMLCAERLRHLAVPAQKTVLDALDRSHGALLKLVESVLATSKLEAGKVTPHPSQIKLGELLEGALEGARAKASEKGLVLHASYEPEVDVRVDVDLTRSAVQNLADNAVRYTDAGGVDVSVEEGRDEFTIHVRDNCQGLSPEELRTIFEPFERGRTRKSGTGLGLAIARRAIEAQGGLIGAESGSPVGCHFWIRLPRAGPDGQR